MDDEWDYAEFANNHSVFDDILVMGKKKNKKQIQIVEIPGRLSELGPTRLSAVNRQTR